MPTGFWKEKNGTHIFPGNQFHENFRENNFTEKLNNFYNVDQTANLLHAQILLHLLIEPD